MEPAGIRTVPLATRAILRGAAIVSATMLVVVGVAWMVYAATTEPGAPGPSYAPDEAAFAGRIAFVWLGLYGLRVLLVRPHLRIGPEALAVVDPLSLRHAVRIDRDDVESMARPERSADGFVSLADPGRSPNLAISLRSRVAVRMRLLGFNSPGARASTRGVLLAVRDPEHAEGILSDWLLAGPSGSPRTDSTARYSSLPSRVAVAALLALMEAALFTGLAALSLPLLTLVVLVLWADARRHTRALERDLSIEALPAYSAA